MDESDLTEFTTVLDSVCALLSRGQYVPSDASTLLFFRKLGQFPIELVRWAFDQHVERSKFPPTPADILDILRGADGRPGPEEAWATALAASDERVSVVWTSETAQAWAVAQPVLDAGDEVGARMAFREAYTAAVAQARTTLTPAVWQLSEGHDPEGRVRAVQEAVRLGRLEAPAAVLPAPRGDVPLLSAPEAVAGLTPDRRAFLAELRERAAAPVPATDASQADRERTAALKREHDERLAAELAEHRAGLEADTAGLLARVMKRPNRPAEADRAALDSLNAWRRQR